jgi:hypothetical protein
MVNENLFKRISQIVLQSDSQMIKEENIRNLCPDEEEFQEIISTLLKSLKTMGFSLIRTTYENERYFVITIPGKDSDISPSMYGVMGLILSVYNELGKDMELDEIKKIFKENWEDIESLVEIEYLKIEKVDNIQILKITPLGKAAFKNVLKELKIKNIIDLQEENV